MKQRATDEQILTALKEHHGIRAQAARALGFGSRAIMARIDAMKAKGVEIPDSTYDGRVAGTSTLYDADGQVKLQWVKETTDEARQKAALEAAIFAVTDKLPRYAATAAPKRADTDFCTLYTLTDCHVGMLSWRRETGADWDLRIAEEILTGVFLQMIESAPASALGILNQLGDFLHFDSLTPETPTNRHVLDADGRYQKVVEAAIRILRRIIVALLKKHPKVYVMMQEGNHDPTASVWLRAMFSALYENEPRLTVNTSPAPYIALQHGKTMLGFHHGHLAKKQSLPLLFAAKYPEIWGATKKRYIHVGHLHHVDEKEHPGVKVIQHPTLAAPDAFAARGGWLSERQATSMTYHLETGEYARGIFVPEMLGVV